MLHLFYRHFIALFKLNLKMKKSLLLFSLFIHVLLVNAQKQPPANWYNLDLKKDKVFGVSTERTYNEILKGKSAKKVIVAVIDGGTDVSHEDLKSVIWVNSKEVADNNKDDDHNGYADDINGWNFIGGPDGKNVEQDNLELTRLYKTYKTKYEKKDTTQLDGAELDNYHYYLKLKKSFIESSEQYVKISNLYKKFLIGVDTLRKDLNVTQTVSLETFKNYNPTNKNAQVVKSLLSKNKQFIKGTEAQVSIFEAFLKEMINQLSSFVDYHYNLDFDPREIVGDNYTNTNEKYYGNNKVSGPHGEHGSHVAGIIGAVRNNGIGINGVADNVEILVLRVVPDGDERDKDVANAIKYAVDNGATVINMSFGKAYSPYKEAVDEAVRYAHSKDVLLIHAAGNDNKNTDIKDNFPNDRMANYNQDNWIEVGASSWIKKKKLLPADFSNYAAENVDVFAPGVDINSCIPDNKYAVYSGTSMAAPVTAGVAAVIRGYYPHLTAAQVKQIILQSAIRVKHKVLIPGTKKKVKMTELCKTGGVVNLYEAAKLAETYKK